MTTGQAAVDALREAWYALPDETTFAGKIARRSLEASAKQDPTLERALFDLQLQAQSELDLHLDGDTVTEHATNALDFANLVRGVAEAVKELTKSSLGRQRMPSTLQVIAPSPGSVRVVFRPEAPKTLDGVVEGSASETWESASLVRVATILARAGGQDGDAVLDALAAGVPIGAHAGLRRAAKAVVGAQWIISGTLRRPHHDSIPVSVGPAGASRLLTALAARTYEEQHVNAEGRVDGQRRSVGAMWFVPSVGQAFEAAVPDAELLDRVASLAAADELVRARFQVIVTALAGSTGGVRRSYSLESIVAVPAEPTLPIED
ncbi:hypothetical protein NY551_18970 [Curtobacterium flaccumfaciens pv. oortii]|uniref:hypothetical protein n=1 Tax=Curtobacterium flaccumfaciens TaxID=2035 RepID=UPI0026580558|nr:hypothetical protein [Curtobacterium flaccumfaciens]MCS5524823.1 hypothetical protein [Curtobacterium flaccumfaciens pv. oortii]